LKESGCVHARLHAECRDTHALGAPCTSACVKRRACMPPQSTYA